MRSNNLKFCKENIHAGLIEVTTTVKIDSIIGMMGLINPVVWALIDDSKGRVYVSGEGSFHRTRSCYHARLKELLSSPAAGGLKPRISRRQGDAST